MARPSVRMRQKYNFQGKFPKDLIHRTSRENQTFGGEFPWKFLVLPHCGRGSRQRPVSITDRSRYQLIFNSYYLLVCVMILSAAKLGMNSNDPCVSNTLQCLSGTCPSLLDRQSYFQLHDLVATRNCQC